MSWIWIGIDWGILGVIMFSAAVLLLSILMLASGPKGPTPRSKRLGTASVLKPLM